MKRRSPVLGCFGLALASFGSLFVLLAIGDIALGFSGDRTGPACAGAMMLGLAITGALLMWRGFTQVADVPNPDFSAGIAMREAFLAKAGPMDARSQRVNEAAGLMLQKRYVESGQSWASRVISPKSAARRTRRWAWPATSPVATRMRSLGTSKPFSTAQTRA